jgi:hypothetical protein
MQGAKPIEPGCLAMVTHGRYCGLIVTVVKMYDQDLGFHEQYNNRIWEIDRELEWLCQKRKQMFRLRYAPEKYLMRIDDDDNLKKFKEEMKNENKRIDRTERPAKEPVSLPD